MDMFSAMELDRWAEDGKRWSIGLIDEASFFY